MLALITLGEGWHNNHHHYMNSANQGFFWWEVDVSYYSLRALALVGVIAAVVISGSTGASISSARSSGFRPVWPRSSTIRTAPHGLRC